MDCNLWDSSVQGVSQARTLEWVAISFSRRFFCPRDWTRVSCIAGGFSYQWTSVEGRRIFGSQLEKCRLLATEVWWSVFVLYDMWPRISFCTFQTTVTEVVISIFPADFNISFIINNGPRGFPDSPVVKTFPFNGGGASSIPGRGAKIPHASQQKSQNIKQKQYCSEFYKIFKNCPHKKKT